MNSKPVLLHAQNADSHAVAAQMRVLITPAGEGGFVAQGLEIDYCATGSTIEDAQAHFADGFLRTIEALLAHGRPLSALFKSRTPPEVWQAYIDGARQDELTCATVVDLDVSDATGLPYQQLAFCRPRQLAIA